MCLQKLPTAARDGLLRPEELVDRLVICEATAEVVSHDYRHSESPCNTVPFAMAAPRYGGPSL